ncbi:MAG TPA: hypothetical protein VLD67_17750 [Vicinamibacterales bacterium]|nr:hypothetical protein [Vicinamibacterales bacterium]
MPANFDSKRLVSVGRDGAELPLSLPPGSYGNPRVSPDGRRVGLERDGAVVETVDLVRGTRASIVAPAIGTNFQPLVVGWLTPALPPLQPAVLGIG